MLEETGIRVKVEQLTGVYKNMKLGVVTLAFRCSVVGGQPHPTDEARKVAWLTLDQAERDMPEARAVRVADALASNDSGPAVRIHDGTRLLTLLFLSSRVSEGWRSGLLGGDREPSQVMTRANTSAAAVSADRMMWAYTRRVIAGSAWPRRAATT